MVWLKIVHHKSILVTLVVLVLLGTLHCHVKDVRFLSLTAAIEGFLPSPAGG